MNKSAISKPFLLLVYGLPGAGKTYFTRQLAENLRVAHVHSDRIRYELFEKPKYDKRENQIVSHLVDYMTGEFLKAGVSVVYDGDTLRRSRRRYLKELATRSRAATTLVWLQIDLETAYNRANTRDHRKIDDRFDVSMDRTTFENYINYMQNPNREDYVVISGKHTFSTQRNTIIKRLFAQGLIDAETATAKVVKPQLVNLIPNLRGGRVDASRRSIFIR